MDKILFIGNSYTYYNDMPKIFEALSNENGHGCKVSSVTKGGRRLIQNFTQSDEFAAEVQNALTADSYYVIFLQDQSLIALDSPEKFFSGVEAHVKASNAERTVLYSTWGRKEGSEELTKRALTSREMAEKIASEYKTAADRLSAEVSNVGLAFAYISERYPDIELYNQDGSHPSYEGSCLATLVHYKTVYGELPNELTSLKLENATEKALLDGAKNI